MQEKLILLVGASGSGKTTIAKELEKEGLNIIHSYTTREPREPNEWGHTFIPQLEDRKVSYIGHSGLRTLNIEGYMDEYEDVFGQKSKVRYIYYNSKVIAYKEIYGEHYWAIKEQYQGKGTSIYVIDPDGAKQVQEDVKDAEIVTIFLMADEAERRLRMHNARLGNERFERIKRDKEIFKTCKCDYVVDGNRPLEEVLELIKEIIGGSNV